jgi:hypothetical protein
VLPEDGPRGPKHVGAEKRTFKYKIVVCCVLIDSAFFGKNTSYDL